MRVRHYSKGKFYVIACPRGTKVVRTSPHASDDQADSHDRLLVPFQGREIAIPADPPELLPLLAESGRCGLSLVGDPVPDMNLAGAVCPNCNSATSTGCQSMTTTRASHIATTAAATSSSRVSADSLVERRPTSGVAD